MAQITVQAWQRVQLRQQERPRWGWQLRRWQQERRQVLRQQQERQRVQLLARQAQRRVQVLQPVLLLFYRRRTGQQRRTGW